jgi:hypothetical protein
MSTGHEWHWVMDDNIDGFYRLYKNRKLLVRTGAMFQVMEDFATRYRNVGMAGPHYATFIWHKNTWPPYVKNCRIYSCNLIRNDTPFRWRGRYNEDTDLSLRMLKSGWATIQYNIFLQKKLATQTLGGGNTEEFYAHEGTLPKSKMLVAMHPDVARLMVRYGRWHHYVDYTSFKELPLIRRTDITIPEGVNEYGMQAYDKETGAPKQL